MAKAIVIHGPGGSDELQVEEVADPIPTTGELIVDVGASGVNFIDTYHRSGLYPLQYPARIGLEGAGTVVGIGTDTEGFSLGDRVGWINVQGSYSNRLNVPADKAVPIPDEVDICDAAASLLQGITAQYLAFDTYELTAASRCLIHAGAGGVGRLLTQLAKLQGAEVIATVGSPGKVDVSRAAGADHVVVNDESGFLEDTEALVGERAFDVVFDGIGAATFEEGLKLLKPRGMMVSFGNASGPVPALEPLQLAANGSLFLTRPRIDDYTATPSEFVNRARFVLDRVATGDLSVLIAEEFSLNHAAAAHRALESGATVGKLLLVP